MLSDVEVHVTLLRVWKGKDPEAICPAGWTKVCDLEDGSILCRLISDGMWKWKSDQKVRVLTSFVAARVRVN